MGIDPVTHAPRLDLVEISSILRSALTNHQSLLNLQSLMGAQALMNPELLKLATTLLALKNQNPDPVSNNLQQILLQAGNQQVESSPLFIHHMPINHTTNMQEGLSSDITNLSCSSSPLQNNPPLPSYLCDENLIISPQQNQVEMQGINQSLGYESVLSTPSSSTYVSNSSAEEQRDTYCSDFFKFEIPESLDISDFL